MDQLVSVDSMATSTDRTLLNRFADSSGVVVFKEFKKESVDRFIPVKSKKIVKQGFSRNLFKFFFVRSVDLQLLFESPPRKSG